MKYRTLLLAFVALFIASGSALAHGGKVRFGVFVGMPYYQPFYYQHYYQSVIIVPAPPPPVYVERQVAPPPPPVSAPAQQSQDWFYCPPRDAYYPYVRECPVGWQRVPAQPSR
jgi:hypothetical protein